MWSRSLAHPQAFLLRELGSRRPLIPRDFVGDAAVAETLATFRTIAETHPESLGAFVISMTKAPSDVLAVYLLQVRHMCVCVVCLSGAGVCCVPQCKCK
jgi:phosphoenolpyruvate carboxylase